MTGETQESLYEGRLFTCTIVGIVRRKPLREVLDRANPIQDERSRLWKCPFCLQDNFQDIPLVWGVGLCVANSIKYMRHTLMFVILFMLVVPLQVVSLLNVHTCAPISLKTVILFLKLYDSNSYSSSWLTFLVGVAAF